MSSMLWQTISIVLISYILYRARRSLMQMTVGDDARLQNSPDSISKAIKKQYLFGAIAAIILAADILFFDRLTITSAHPIAI